VLAATALLVAYLGFSGGGYDLLVWGEVGLVVWWALLLAAILGVVRLRGAGVAVWVPLGALAGLTVWTALGLSWGHSAERGVVELARLVTYLGLFVGAVMVARAGQGRALVGGVAVALAAIGVVALLSRLHPAWFPAPKGSDLLAERNRLDYPLNYFNGLAALLGLGITVLAGLAVVARGRASRAVSAAALPAMVLALYFTLSRGGFLAAGIGLLTLLALAPDRLPKLASLLVPAAGSAVLILVASGRQDLQDGLSTATAKHQGDQLLLLTLGVCVAVGLLAPAAAGLCRQLTGGWRPSRGRGAAVAVVVVVAGATLFLSAGGAQAVSDGWTKFREPNIQATANQSATRLTNVSGRGRYQFWRSAIDAGQQEPVHGIGPGGFAYWWAEHGRLDRFIQNAHSLYLETFAELGIVGLALVLAFVGSLLLAAARHALGGGDRALAAVGAASCASFAASAAIEWVWQIPVLPAAFLMLGAAGVARWSRETVSRPVWAERLGFAAVAVAALAVLVPPVIGSASLRSSQEAVAAGRLAEGLGDARSAERAQPYAGSPKVQRALIEERGGDLVAADSAIREATSAEPRDWRIWVIRSRIEARRGRARKALRAYQRAKALSPRSILFKP
jgi:O-Antigen ligase